ncbi:uncharacterized protein K441DRAFT_52105 [Cenococcum geophilum 1.58]|uniref:Uncharacterized protein n=1 Tax=Cenococcum geophilum 1.58 TaxID=794803 RepID=A0ACC8EK07_9PEZI|nr:hypothetical protein K441DRAFT_52105 [Cenococcum geophilum 1.58]
MLKLLLDRFQRSTFQHCFLINILQYSRRGSMVVVMFCVGDPAEPRLATCSGFGEMPFWHENGLPDRALMACINSSSPIAWPPWLLPLPPPSPRTPSIESKTGCALTASPLRPPTPPKSPATTPPRLKLVCPYPWIPLTKRPSITRISVHWPTLRWSTPYNR